MKSKIIFAMLSAAMCVPVLAQQIAVYGVLDQAVRSAKLDSTGSQTRMISGSFTTSRLGFQGKEDIGGGFNVSFILEGGLDGTDGTVGNGTNLFSREASVSVTSPAGTVTLGRTDTSESVAVFVGLNNFGNFALIPPNVQLAIDRENTIRYSTPAVSGIVLHLGHSMATIQGPKTDSLSTTFVRGDLGLTASYDRAGLDNYKALGARYDFGFVSVGGMYSKRESINTEFKTISARAPLSAGLALHGSHRVRETLGQEIKITAVGVSKSLSLRTMLVAVYQNTDRGTAAGSFYQGGIVHRF